MESFIGIFTNPVFIVSFYAWLIAQVMKVFTFYFGQKKFDLTRVVGSGGMPSSHTSLVMGLSTSIGLTEGWNSSIYIAALIFSLIIMYDASGVRRAVGKQAAILNRMIKELQEHKKIQEGELKELVGHTPIEVIAGAFLGIIVANWII